MNSSSNRFSIIIPCLNEEEFLEKTLNRLKSECQGCEIVLVDSGSSDESINIATGFGATILSRPEYRGNKSSILNEGAKHSTGEVFLFLDADTILPKGFKEEILLVLNQKNVIGGAFELSFDHCPWPLQIVQWINRLRYRYIDKLYYGDQALFVKKTAFDQVGGYPNVSIMESAHLCKLLRKKGILRLLRSATVTSSRRFIKGGIFNVFFMDMRIWALYHLGMKTSRLAKIYWSKK